MRAIHDAGKLHRDLKPSNVLVAPDGRLTILDFGLATPSSPDGTRSFESTAGTPAHMAPEQLFAGGACAASGWYAVGMMLFEALTGRWPFTRSVHELLAAKLGGRPPPDPRDLCPSAPEDLARLAKALLAHRQPITFYPDCDGLDVIWYNGVDTAQAIYFRASDGGLLGYQNLSANFGGSATCVTGVPTDFSIEACPTHTTIVCGQ